MLTWTLWRDLRHPPRSHPLYWRVVQQGQAAGQHGRGLQILGGLLIAGLALLLASSALSLLVCGVIVLPVLVLVGSSGFYAALSAMDTAEVLTQEALAGTHDLLRVTPSGAPAVDWLVASACLSRHQRFEQTHRLVRAITLAGGLALAAVTLFLLASVMSAQEQERYALTFIAFNNVTRILALLVIVYLDHVYSFIAGGLVGIITAYTVSSPLEARVWAVCGFWGQQIVAYALALGLTLLTWAALEQALAPTAGRALLMAASSVMYYMLIREALLRGLWRWMLHVSLGMARAQPVELR